ncbi:MAG: ABC transporter ATP-binding protein [Rickettsiaceae bacterium]
MLVERKLKSKQIIKRLLREHVAPFKGKVFTAIFFMVIVAVCSAAIVRLTKPAIDRVLIEHDQQMLIVVTCLIVAIYLIKGIAEYFQSYIIKFVGQQILTNLQMRMYEHLLSADYLFIQSQSSGRLISRFTNDIVLMRGAVSNLLVGCAKHFLSVVFLIGIMFSLDPFLSAFVFLSFPTAIYPIQKLGRRMRAVTNSAQEELGNFTAKLDEAFYSIKVIKSFCTEKIEASRARKITSNILGFYKKSAKLDSLVSPVMEILSGFTIACLIWYGEFAISSGKMTTGTLFTFITAFVSSYRPFKSLVSLNVNLQEGIAAANRVFNILDLKPVITDAPSASKVKFRKPYIEFKDIGIKFANGKSALKSLNLKIEAGNTYAFVGGSGSGKTTVANLVIRMFDPTEGRVLIDGHDIKEVSLRSLRKQISMVAQETMLFDSTVAENIAYGFEGATREQIINAAKAADAHTFIESLPNGYDTLIGADGKSLSGGQRQRLSIARAFLKDAAILVLDEATSALDPNSEQSIINSLTELRKNKTTLIITHRLSSIKDADQIIVMKNGGIVEQGKHEDLLKMQKEYYKLYNKELKETNKHV